MKKRIALIFGTRPEAIKMAPVYIAMKNDDELEPVVVATAQHRQMLDQILELFGVKADYDLDIMKERQSLPGLTSRLIQKLDEVFEKDDFAATLVQGDTTSTFAGSLVSFYHKIPVGHVEAGLRTNNMYDPFPEEINRRLNGVLSTYHYPPTEKAKLNLLVEGVDESRIELTGNTVIDALKWTVENKKHEIDSIRERYDLSGKEYVLMTMHRRENWGEPMKNVMKAVKILLEQNSNLHLIFPVHLNPAVREIVFPELENHDRITLTDPLDYLPFIALMQGSRLILSDSGGVQEEAPTLGKPVLVLRQTTERPEAVDSGVAKLVGTDLKTVVDTANELLNDTVKYRHMAESSNPFGDGKAAARIVSHLKNHLIS